MVADDCATLFINSNPFSNTQTTMITASKSSFCIYEQGLLCKNDKPQPFTTLIPLNQDDYHYFELFHTQRGGS
jgi:hypothetical protein